MVVGRLMRVTNVRAVIAVGVLITAYSLWQMTGWTAQVAPSVLIEVTMVQGFGMGFVFLPLQVVAFATLPPQYRADGVVGLNGNDVSLDTERVNAAANAEAALQRNR